MSKSSLIHIIPFAIKINILVISVEVDQKSIYRGVFAKNVLCGLQAQNKTQLYNDV